MSDTKPTMVKLSTEISPKTKDAAAKNKTKSFEIGHANKLLSLANPRWKLADEKFKWNGKEIAKVSVKA